MALWLAFTLRLEVWHWPSAQQLWVYAVSPLLFLPVFVRFGLYRAIFRYTGLATMQTLLTASVVYGLLFLGVVLATFPFGVPRSVGVLQPILFLGLVSNSRAWARFWLNRGARSELRQRLLIYGAGSAGAQTAAAVANGSEFELLGFVDNDSSKIGRHINGVPVFAPNEVASVVDRLGVSDILLALPSLQRYRRHQIIEGLRSLPVHIRTLPGMAAALSLGFGLLAVTRGRNLAVWLSVFAAGIGLYLSGSRSTLFLAFAALIVWALVVSLKLRGWRRAIPLLAAVAVALAAHWTLDHGYRGISYALLNQQLHEENLKSLNVALSNRPEIWAAALRMYFEFPFFGLGQGAFYRLSALPEFSGSEFLVRVHGEGVHSEFLRILVELGPIGLGLVLFMYRPSVSIVSEHAP